MSASLEQREGRPGMGSQQRVAGRELDAEIASRVFGLIVQYIGIPVAYMDSRELFSDAAADAFAKAHPLAPPMRTPRPYSTDIAAAMQVMQRANDECRAFALLSNTPDGTWIAQFGVFDPVEAKTAPLAICLAALASLPAFETMEAAAKRLAASPSTLTEEREAHE